MGWFGRRWLIAMAAIVVVGVLVSDVGLGPMTVAVLGGAVILKAGIAVLASMAQPIPEPPPPGELRKVKIGYRCEICGSELRMVVANDDMPDPPRHCLEDMVLMTPVE
jgi:hypothetical protein